MAKITRESLLKQKAELEEKVEMFTKFYHPRYEDVLQRLKSELQILDSKLVFYDKPTKVEEAMEDIYLNDSVSNKLAESLEFDFIRYKSLIDNGRMDEISPTSIKIMNDKLTKIKERQQLASKSGKKIKLPDFLNTIEKLVEENKEELNSPMNEYVGMTYEGDRDE